MLVSRERDREVGSGVSTPLNYAKIKLLCFNSH